MPAALNSRFLMELRLDVAASHMLGDTPAGGRRIDVFMEGRFEGPRLKGVVLPGGSDLLLRRQDGAMQPDVRLWLKTDDDALILMSYRGIRHGPPDVMARIADGESVDPSEYYLRSTPCFETSAAPYAWLNRIVAVGIGRREPDAAVYDIHEIL